VIVAAGLTVTVATAVPVQPAAFVPVTVYEVVLVGLTEIGLVVAPVFQEYVEAPEAVNVAVAPLQIVGELTVIVAGGLTVTVATAVPVHPAASVPVTVYEVVLVGETEIGLVVAPVFHEYVEAPEAVNVAVAPLQIVGELTVIVAGGLIVTVATAVAEQPVVVPVTVYEVVLVGVTVIEFEVEPLLHE
jgi:hypothetical protein